MRGFLHQRGVQWVVVIGIFLFLGKIVWDHWTQVRDFPFTFRGYPMILGTLLYASSYFIQIWAWYIITQKMGIALSFPETWSSWLYSQLGKYLPGKVWIFLGRLYFYESKGKSRKEISIALYFETLTMLLAAGLLFLTSLLFSGEVRQGLLKGSVLWIGSLFVVAFFFLHPRILEKIFNRVFFRYPKDPVSLTISYAEILWILLICILTWAVEGVGFSLFVGSVFPISPHEVLFLTGALAFATVAGLLALFAPSGLGVREGALVYLLSYLMPDSVAVIISVLTRLWTTLIEIALTGVIYLVSYLRDGGRQESGHV